MEPNRLPNIPALAIWNDRDNEWELAERDDSGKRHGATTWWRSDGTKCCVCEYIADNPAQFTRFHPNGEVSRIGHYESGKLHGDHSWARSTAATPEHFVGNHGNKVWRVTGRYVAGQLTDIQLFNKAGALCDAKGKALPPPETATAATDAPAVPAHWQAPPPSKETDEFVVPNLPTELRNGIWVTPQFRALLWPRHGGISVPVRPVPSAQVAWGKLRRSIWASDNAYLAAQLQKGESAQSRIWLLVRSDDAAQRAFALRLMNPTAQTASFDDDAYLVSQCMERYSGVIGHFAEDIAVRIVDFLVATVGLVASIERCFAGLKDELPYTAPSVFGRLRDLMSTLPASEHAAAKAAVQTSLATQLECADSDRDRRADLQWAASFLLPLTAPRNETNTNAVEAVLFTTAMHRFAGKFGSGCGVHACGIAASDVAGLATLHQLNGGVRHEMFASGKRMYLASIMELEGVAAVDVLCGLKPSDPWERDPYYNGRWCLLLAHFDDDRAIARLCAEHAKFKTATNEYKGEAGQWAPAALGLAMAFQPERVTRVITADGQPDLLAMLRDNTWPNLPGGAPAEEAFDQLGVPTGYSPPERAPSVRFAVDVPAPLQVATIVDFRDDERAAALEHGIDDDAVTWNGKSLRHVSDADREAWLALRERWAIPSEIECFSHTPRSMHARLNALGFVVSKYYTRFGMSATCLASGETLIPLLAASLQHSEGVEYALITALAVGHLDLVPGVLHAFVGKKNKAAARAWLLRQPDHAIAGSIALVMHAQQQTAASKKKSKGSASANELFAFADAELPAAAMRALRFLDSQGKRSQILGWAQRIDAVAAITAVLDADPLLLPKAKVPKLPAFVDATTLPALQTASGETLSATTVQTLLTHLAWSNADEVHPGVTALKATCTATSRAAFSWELFMRWLDPQRGKADAKEGWAMQAVGFLGDDECARKITALAKDWPGAGASARAQAALDVLLNIGSETALVNLNLLAEKSKFPAFKQAAAERIKALADARGLTSAELQDRLVPTLGLDETGGTKLDFGPRHFVLSFDEALRPIVRDATGKLLKDLPKPGKTDDAAIAKASAARFAGLKKDSRTSATLQLTRLERMMQSQRSVTGAQFLQYFVQHPWMVHLSRRLVWGVRNPDGAIAATLRVAEDGTLASITDDVMTIAPTDAIVLMHPLRLDPAALAAWARVFADYELLQPFLQLARPTYAVTEAEAASQTLARFAGKQVHPRTLRQLEAKGWALVVDSWIGSMDRPVALTATAATTTATMEFQPGWYPGAGSDELEAQTLAAIELNTGHWAAVDKLAFSELIHDVTELFA
ncbi:MAG TPA: DUF4132 domain-containing protein [Kofleriaceae bacterium]|nr:DUF4132 domain-containing protein [Kofleriaceae bacterium]